MIVAGGLPVFPGAVIRQRRPPGATRLRQRPSLGSAAFRGKKDSGPV